MLIRQISVTALVLALFPSAAVGNPADPPGRIFDNAMIRCAENKAPRPATTAASEQAPGFQEQAREIILMQRSGEYERAIDAADFLLAHRGACQSLDRQLRGELANAHGLALSGVAEHERAIRIFSLLEDWPAPDVLNHSPVALKSKYNLALALWGLGRFEESLETLDLSLADHMRELGSDAPETQNVQFGLASRLQRHDRLIEAETTARALLARQQARLGREHPRTLRTQGLLGHISSDLNRTQIAVELLDAVYSVEETALAADHPVRLTAGNNLANALQDLGEMDEALSIHREILDIRERGKGPTSSETLVSLHNVANVLLQLDRLDDAADIAARSLEQHVEQFGQQHRNTLHAAMLVARVERAKGNLEVAERMLSDVAQTRLDILGEANSDTFDAFMQLAELQARMPGGSLRAAKNYAGLLIVADEFDTGKYGKARRRAERIRFGFANAAWQLSNSPTPDRGEDTPSHNEIAEMVLEALQKTQNNAASGALARVAALQYAAEQDITELVLRRERLIAGIDAISEFYTTTLTDTDSQPGKDFAQREEDLRRLNRSLQDVEGQIRELAPEYFAFIAPKPLSLEDTGTLLRDGEAALILVPTRRGTHILLMADGELHWHRSDWTARAVNSAVQRLLWDVGSQIDVDTETAERWLAEGDGAYPYDFKTAELLYRELIAPIRDKLDGRDHLFVAASGALSTIPLSILVEEVPEGSFGDPETLRQARWFGDDIALVQLPNLQSLDLLRRFDRGTADSFKHDFIGFGDPLLEGKAANRSARNAHGARQAPDMRNLFTRSANSAGSVNPSVLRQLSRLPGTAAELDAMWRFFGQPENALFLAEQATESSVSAVDLDARVIAFATHGLVAGEVSGISLPGLVMTPPESASEADDGYLSSEDVATLSLRSDWVILSACNTAAGDGTEGGSGLGGLARAFFYAGADRLLASHWPVRDDVAGELTLRALQIGKDRPKLSKAQALQKAIIAIRNDPRADSDSDTWAHPAAWAPFVLVGDR